LKAIIGILNSSEKPENEEKTERKIKELSGKF
jgi:hypothetical protein